MILALLASAALAAEPDTLARFLDGRRPWETWEANSEQRQPVYLGKTPLELALGAPDGPAALPETLRAAGEGALRRLAAALKARVGEFELWPAYDERARPAWAVARWRRPGSPWRWLSDAGMNPASAASGRLQAAADSGAAEGETPVLLPRTLDPRVPADNDAIFMPALRQPGLYDKPAYGDCIWTDPAGRAVEAWRTPGSFVGSEQKYRAWTCRALPQPAFVNGRPRTFVARVDASGVRWPEELSWAAERPFPAAPEAVPALAWPPGFAAAFLADARALSGEADLVFRSGRRVRLERKSSAQPDHQLGEVVDWLEERYRALGFTTWRDRFEWQGIPQENLFAALPGTLPAEENRPVLLADHVDTAFAEDVFKASGTRVSVPGADDDVSGTAALLRAAEALKGRRPRHDVWFVHLTGEEFPADDLGARRLVRGLLSERRRLGGLILLDMVAYRDPGDPVLQLSVGEGSESEALAAAALALASRAAAGFAPVLRRRSDPLSYLYNTDALIFSHAGYPVVLLNEHLNYEHNLERRHYHESSDTVDKLDPALAEAAARTAAEAALWLASREDAPPRLPAGALAVPLVRQATSYSCGAAAMQAVFQYWGVYDGGESGLYARLETTPEQGTDPRVMARAARALGLSAELAEKMTLEDLRRRLDLGQTVVLDLQAWAEDDPTPGDWSDNWEDGHYVVLVAMDDERLYVMDPSVGGAYAWLPARELPGRWHDYEDRDGRLWRNRGLGLAVWGERPADRTRLERVR